MLFKQKFMLMFGKTHTRFAEQVSQYWDFVNFYPLLFITYCFPLFYKQCTCTCMCTPYLQLQAWVITR